MNVVELCNAILDGLEAYDKSVPPLGLYAGDDLPVDDRKKTRYQVWHYGLRPHLKSLGCRTHDFFFGQETEIVVPELGRARLQLIRISKIKVRKFGSHYRVDNHENYAERWDELKLDKHLSNLWKPSSLADARINLRTVVFIGFDKAADPFGKELTRLERELGWEEHQAVYQTRSFPDRYERNFHVRLAVWARLARPEAGT